MTRPRENPAAEEAQLLAGLRVTELTDERGFLAGKIMADLGAEVTKIEPPAGDPERAYGPWLGGVEKPEASLPWLAMNTGKRSLALDLRHPAGMQVLDALLEKTDVLLLSLGAAWAEGMGLDWPRLHADFPRLVCCSITAFGLEGPRAGDDGHDLVVVAAGGNAWMTGDAEGPPLRCSMPSSYYHAAPEAVVGTLQALHARELDGLGRLVDLSMQECQLATLITAAGQQALGRGRGQRSGARTGASREIWRAADGWISFGLRGGPARAANLRAVCSWMEERGKLASALRDRDWDSWDPGAVDSEELRGVESAFGKFFSTMTMTELYQQALKRRVLLAPCNGAREILAQPQLRSREMFVTIDYPRLGASVEHPALFAMLGGTRPRLRRAPLPGEHNPAILDELELSDEQRQLLTDEGVA